MLGLDCKHLSLLSISEHSVLITERIKYWELLNPWWFYLFDLPPVSMRVGWWLSLWVNAEGAWSLAWLACRFGCSLMQVRACWICMKSICILEKEQGREPLLCSFQKCSREVQLLLWYLWLSRGCLHQPLLSVVSARHDSNSVSWLHAHAGLVPCPL